MPTLKFGKLAPRIDPRTLKLARYLDTDVLPAPPDALDLSAKVPAWPMYLNDQLGCCTCAAAGHMTQLWTSLSGKPIAPTDAQVEAMYIPGTGSQDTGRVELDVLRYWRKHGLDGEKAYAFASIDPHNHDDVKLALLLFGGVYLGFQITDEQQLVAEFNAGAPWTPESGSTVQGGHAVNLVAYDADTVTVVTWGRLQRGTWAWFDSAVDEAWGILPSSWAKRGADPIPGFAFTQLQADLAAIGAVQP